MGLEKIFKDFWGRPRVQALKPLTLSLERGEILALLGPNGAGKSTTIKLLLGLLFPTRGRVLVMGGSPRSAAVRARVGYLPEETRLYRFLDARETLSLFARLHGLPRAERRRRADELIEMVGLRGNERRPVGEFSKGMARRIGLAVALVGDPDLLILDEPTSGLDPLGTREIKDLLEELRRRGRTVLLSSHLLDDVEDVADRIAILYGGQLQRLGRTQELLCLEQRLRVEFPRPPASGDLEARIREALPEVEHLEISTPSDRLESLFRRVVLEAQESLSTPGARAGGRLASFLCGGPQGPQESGVSPPTGPPVEAPSAQTEAGRRLVESLRRRDASPLAPPPPPVVELEPGPPVGSAASRFGAARVVLARLTGASPQEEPAPPPGAPQERAPSAPPPLSSSGDEVLRRLLGEEGAR